MCRGYGRVRRGRHMTGLDGFLTRSLRCSDCRNFDRGPGNFDSPNLRKCFADGRGHWPGDGAGIALTSRSGRAVGLLRVWSIETLVKEEVK
jgi:hypothetical protein